MTKLAFFCKIANNIPDFVDEFYSSNRMNDLDNLLLEIKIENLSGIVLLSWIASTCSYQEILKNREEFYEKCIKEYEKRNLNPYRIMEFKEKLK